MSNYLLQAGIKREPERNRLFITDCITGTVHTGDFKKSHSLHLKNPKGKKR